MEQIHSIMSTDESYKKAIVSINTGLDKEKYLISKDEVVNNRIDKINNHFLQKTLEKVVLGYENLLDEKDDTIVKLKETLVDNNIPVPKNDILVEGNIVSTSEDKNKIKRGYNRMAGFLNDNVKNGEKFYISSGDKVQAYRRKDN